MITRRRDRHGPAWTARLALLLLAITSMGWIDESASAQGASSPDLNKIDKGFHDPRSFAKLGNAYLFVAQSNDAWKSQLWRTDGTSEGTIRLMEAPMEEAFYNIQIVGSTAYVCSSSGKLWKSDGTTTGTTEFKLEGVNRFYQIKAPGGNKLFFRTPAYSRGCDLWVTDGTTSGTLRLKAPPANATIASVEDLGPEMNGRLFFDYRDDANKHYICATDGTTSGTFELLELSYNEMTDFLFGSRAIVNGLLYFSRYNREIWKTDGTPAGTNLAFRLDPGVYTKGITGANNQNRIFGVLGIVGPEQKDWLFTSDGTAQGTRTINNPHIFTTLSYSMTDCNPVSIGSRVFFFGTDGHGFKHLWTSDGTDEGTRQVDGGDKRFEEVGPAKAIGGNIFFSAKESMTSPTEGWIHYGSTMFMRRIGTLEPAIKSDLTPACNAEFIGELNNRILMTGSNESFVWDTGTIYVMDMKNGVKTWRGYE